MPFIQRLERRHKHQDHNDDEVEMAGDVNDEFQKGNLANMVRQWQREEQPDGWAEEKDQKRRDDLPLGHFETAVPYGRKEGLRIHNIQIKIFDISWLHFLPNANFKVKNLLLQELISFRKPISK